MASKKAEPTPLQDAIRAQQSVINQLADEHAKLSVEFAATGSRLMQAHQELNALLARQAAE